MTNTLVRHSASVASVGSGTQITVTLPAPSDQHDLLVIGLTKSASAAVFTLPAGWTRAVQFWNAEVWYYEDNPGGISSVIVNSDITSNLKGWMAQWHTDLAGYLLRLNATGSGGAGAVTQDAATTTTAALAGDVAVGNFMWHHTTAQAISFTDPSGFAVINDDHGTVTGNHIYSCYSLSVAEHAALTITATSSVAAATSYGWSGTVATFTATPTSPGTGSAGHVGAWLNYGQMGASTLQQAISWWTGWLGRPLTVRHIYYGQGSLPTTVTTDMQADIAAGRKLVIALRPAFNPPTPEDAAKLDTFLSALQAAGAEAVIHLWQEPTVSARAGGASEGITPALFIAAWRYYWATIHQYFPLGFNTSSGALVSGSDVAYYPGDDWVDEITTDYYCSSYVGGQRLDTLHALNDAASPDKPFGLSEIGTGTGQTQAQATAYLNYLKTWFTARIAAGLPVTDIMWFNSSGSGASMSNPITSGSDFRVPLLTALFDALDSAVIGGTPPSIITDSLPDATVAVRYEATIGETGGTAPFTWTQPAGTLPPGLSLESAGGGDWGAFLNQDNLGVTSFSAAKSAWDTITGRSLAFTSFYLYSIPANLAAAPDLAYCAANGISVYLSLHPALNGSDAAALSTFLASCRAGGLQGYIALWHEPSYNVATAAQYLACVNAYKSVIRGAGYPLAFWGSCYALADNNETDYFQAGLFDAVLVDFYCDRWLNNSITLDQAAALADADAIPLGIAEHNSAVLGGGNWLTGDSAGFENGIGDWTNASAYCSVSRSTAYHNDGGTASLAVACTGGGNAVVASHRAVNYAQMMPTLATHSVKCSAYINRGVATARTVHAGAEFYDSGGNSLGQVFGASAFTETASFTQLSDTVTAPTNAVWARALVQIVSPGAETHYIDDVWLTDMSVGQSQSDATNFFSYVKTFMAGRLNAGKTNAPVLLFSSDSQTPVNKLTNAIRSAGDYRDAIYQSEVDLTSNAAILSGTPSGGGGVYSFTVQITDNASKTDTQAFVIAVGAATAVSISTATLNPAEAGVAFTQTLAAANGTAPYTWSVTGGTLPPGLTLTSGGVLSGNPTTAGSYGVTIQVADATGGTNSASYTMTVAAALAIPAQTLPGGTVGVPYSQALTATGGSGTKIWTTAGGALPGGLNLGSDGVITGTPTTPGTATFTVQVTDSFTLVTASMAITVVSLRITTTSLPAATTGIAYSASLAVTGGTAPYNWTVAGGALPPGINLTGGTGALTGVPSVPGTYQVTFRVTDNAALTADITLSVQVNPPGDSLVIAGQIELLGGGVVSSIPACAGASFILQPGYDLGAPQRADTVMVSQILDGERPVGRRAANRVISLPVKITAPSRAILAAAREVLLQLIDHDPWQLTWTRDGGPPMVLDCFRAEPTVMGYQLEVEQQLIAQMVISFQALPFGRSDQATVVDFPSPVNGRSAPAAPVLVDDFAVVSGANWAQSPIGPGTYSAFWHTGTSGVGAVASYSKAGLALNLTGHAAVTFYAGFGSTDYFFSWARAARSGRVLVTVTLTDNNGHTISNHVIRSVKASADSQNPVWQKIRVPLPAGVASFNYGNIAGYQVTVSSRVSGDLPYTDLYLSSVYAVPVPVTGVVSPQSGTVYDLAGIIGSARSPMSLMLQQPAGSVATLTKSWTAPGPFVFTAPPGAGVGRVRMVAGGGYGGTCTSSGNMAGGGAGGNFAEDFLTFTARQTYAGQVGAGGKTGASPVAATDSFLTGDNGTVTAIHGGGVALNTHAGGSPGAAYTPIEQVTGQNASFDGGIGTWTGAGSCTVGYDATQHQAGTGCLAVTSTGGAGSDMTAASCTASTVLANGEPCSGGQKAVINGYSKAATAARSVQIGAEFYDANGTSLGQLFGSTVTNTTTGWTAFPTANLTCPDGAVWLRVLSKTLATAGASEKHWTDSVSVKTGTSHLGGAGGSTTDSGPTAGGGGGAAGVTGNGGAGGSGATGGAGGTAGTGGLAGAGGLGGAFGGTVRNGKPGQVAGGGGGGGTIATGAGNGGGGRVDLTYTQTAPFKYLIAHRPGGTAPDTLSPFVPVDPTDLPDGATEYAVPSLIPDVNARFGSTYTVILVNLSWNSPATARTVTVKVTHYEQAGGASYSQSASRTVTPSSLKSPFVVLGEMTIPDHAMADDNTSAYFTVTVQSGKTGDRFQDVLFLDCAGSTVMVESPVAYTSYWIDEPLPDRDVGNILASQFDRATAVSVLAYATVSGPPLHVDPLGATPLFVYAGDPAASAPSAQMTYWPRWMLDRAV